MKLIEVIIPPGDVEKVARALAVEGVTGMTLTQVHGWGVRRGLDTDETGADGEVQLRPKLKVEMVVLANEADAVMERLESALTSSGLGPAKMFCWPVDAAVHTRSGTRDHQALAWRFVAGK